MTQPSRRRRGLRPALGLALAWIAMASAEELKHPRDLTYSPLKFEPPPIETRVLSNGVYVYLLEDHDLPYFRLTLWMRPGWCDEPLDKSGLSYLTGQAMSVGGTESRDPEAFDTELGASGEIRVCASTRAITVSCDCLSRDRNRSLGLFAGLLLNPAFDEEKLLQERAKLLEHVLRKNDYPKKIVWREFHSRLYGRSHPIYHDPEPETVMAITRADVVGFHRKYFVPAGAVLGAAGNFEADELAKRLEALLGGWKGSHPALTSSPPPTAQGRQKISLVDKELTQAGVRIGHSVPNPPLKDLYAIHVMNRILGDGPASRLYHEVRSSRGLAYNIRSYFDHLKTPAEFGIVLETGTANAKQAISLALGAVRGLRTKPVGDEELDAARKAIINAHIFRFENAFSLVWRRVQQHFHGLPGDYVASYPDRALKVTAADVQRVAQKYLKPDEAVIAVVGDAEKLESPLSTLGPVKVINLRDYGKRKPPPLDPDGPAF